MNESVHNSTNSAGATRSTEMGDQADGHVMSVDSVPSVSMMQSTMLTDLQLIYMLQQQQQQQGGAGEAAMMLSPGSLPLLMSSCQVMALHSSVSQQFVSSSSTGTSPSSLARSPLLAADGSIVWHPAGNDDQLSDNFDEDHHQGTSFSQHAQGNGGLSQQTASVVVSRNPLLVNSHQQLLTVNGSVAAFPGYSVVNAASTVGHSSGFVASAPSKIVVAAPPKTSLAAPKKPLTPYMKFSKSIWQHVKNANPSMSVCEVGASIGRLWREMADTDKQKYNDEFQREKAVYEVDLQTYLRATGLQVSDLAKSKKKDTRDRSKAGANAAAIANQNYPKTVMALPLSNSSPVTLATGREGDSEGTRLPHISQMWSGHSVTQQPQATAATSQQVQNILKTVCNPFDATRLKMVDVNNQSLQEHDAHSSPGGAAVVSNEMPSGMSWTWMKAVEPITIDPTRSFSLDALDSSHSAYLPQDQGAIATPAANQHQHQQPLMEFYSASDSLEPGEVVVEGLQPTSFVAKVSSSPQNGSIVSAHNMYNSYAVNPWNRYKLAAAAGPKLGEAIFNREQILHTELVHLRGSLSEKTKEVEQLSKELEIAYELINKLQQQDNPPSQSVPHPGESVGSILLTNQPDGKLDGQEPSSMEQGGLFLGTDKKQVLGKDMNIRNGESMFDEQDLKKELIPEVDVKPGGSDEREVADEFHRSIGNLLSTRMQERGVNLEQNGSTGPEVSSVGGGQPEDVNIAPNHQFPLGMLPEYSMPGRGHQGLPVVVHGYQSAADDVESTTESQRIVVAQFPDQPNVVMLQFESSSSMQPEQDQKAQQNQELETEEAVAPNRQEGVSDEMPSTSCFSGEELKDSCEAVTEEIVSEQEEMILAP